MDAHPCIVHRDQNRRVKQIRRGGGEITFAAHQAHCYHEVATPWRKLGGIGKQIHQDLRNSIRINPDRRQIRADLQRQVLLPLVDEGKHRLHHVVYDWLQRVNVPA